MADIYCHKCGEPWDLDTLHEEVERRYPGQPWLVSERPEEYGQPVTAYYRQHPDGRWYSQKEYDKYFGEVKKDFHTNGCVALGGSKEWCNSHPSPKHSDVGTMISELAGDDIDFEISMWDDAERWGLL